MKKRRKSIIYEFTLVFLVSTVFIIMITAVFMYNHQWKMYKEQTIASMRSICMQLKDEIEAEGDNFLSYQKYMLEHSDEIYVPVDFDELDYKKANTAFLEAFVENYHDKEIYGKDVTFDELPDDLKRLYATMYYEHWLLRFEYFRTVYDLPYNYYMYPSGEGSHIIYVIDLERVEEEKTQDGRMHLMDDYEEDPNELAVCFQTWETGSEVNDYDEFDNEYGRTYSYYLPVYINGEKCGIVGVDKDIDKVNKEIIRNILESITFISLIIITAMVFAIIYINKYYVSRLFQLNEYVEEYARDKDSKIIEKIKEQAKGNDEIDVLSKRIVFMINQIQKYIDEVMNITENLSSTNEKLERMTELSEKDGLTGLGNKFAYLKTEKRLNEMVKDQIAHFAIIMIDLNFLKKMNDDYGHDKGDLAIQKISQDLKTAFPNNRIFRIGGDEFVVVVEDYGGLGNIEIMVNNFKSIVSINNGMMPWEQVSAAVGYAEYDKNTDVNTNNTFKRADDMMYRNKKIMKAERNN